MKLKVSLYYTIEVDETDYDGDPFDIENQDMTPEHAEAQLSAGVEDFSHTVERVPEE